MFHPFPDFIPYKGLKDILDEGCGFLYKAGTLLLLYYVLGEVAESVDGSRLLSGCGGKTSPRVRIPASPPYFLIFNPVVSVKNKVKVIDF